MFFIIALPFIIWALSRRIKNISQTVEDLAELKERVEELEKAICKEAIATVAPPPKVHAPTPLPPQPVKVEAVEEAPQVPAHIPEIEVPPKPAPAEAVPPVPRARIRIWLCKKMTEEEWEAVVGGSWLNKIGILVLVIGLALFLGYSLKYFGPAWRVSIGLAVSFAMLIGGVILERRTRYAMYSWGLIGGGWAALYFTTYAMHGIKAARIIDDPLVGMILLGVVAAGMIVHSLRYRSEIITGLAYFVGFITLIISPVSGFSLAASIPLAASLLVIAYRFSWIYMTVLGLISMYGVNVLRYIGVPPIDFANGQTVLIIYWLLFEGFDLLSLRKRAIKLGIEHTLFPLNACGFIVVSLLNWPTAVQENLYIFFAASSAAYFASTLVRTRLHPPSSFPETAGIVKRVWAGGYEEAITLAAGLAVVAIFKRFTGLEINIALLLEAELLFLAGVFFRQFFLRTLGGIILVLPVLKVLATDIGIDWSTIHKLSFAGLNLRYGTHHTLLTAAVLYLNRLLLSPARKPKPELEEQWGHSAVGAGVLVFILAYEVPVEYLGIGWLVFSLPLFELGLHKRFNEFRLQSYAVAILAFAALAAVNLVGIVKAPAVSPWLVFGLGAVLTHATAVRLYRLAPRRLDERERWLACDGSVAAGTALLATFLWSILPVPIVAVGWGILALLLIELGFYLPLQILRRYGNLMAALAFNRLFLGNFTIMGETLDISHRILTVVPFIFLFYYLSSRLRAGTEKVTLAEWEKKLSRIYFYAPGLLAAVLIRFELGRGLSVIGWAILMLVLLYFGVRQNNKDLRWQSYALAVLTFFRCWATNFYIPEIYWGQFGRVVIGIMVIGSLFAAQVLSPRHPETIPMEGRRIKRWAIMFDLHARTVFAVLATVLLAALLYYEVPGRLLTVAWALEGTAFLVVGFPMREQVLRLSGLILLLGCVVKVFLYDFRELEAVFRILSFIALGLLLLCASLVYTRFREDIRRYF